MAIAIADSVTVSIADDKKGERLVALIPAEGNENFDEAMLREQLKSSGVNALMMPAQWIRVDAMPKLGSGKTDFTAARELAVSVSA